MDRSWLPWLAIAGVLTIAGTVVAMVRIVRTPVETAEDPIADAPSPEERTRTIADAIREDMERPRSSPLPGTAPVPEPPGAQPQLAAAEQPPQQQPLTPLPESVERAVDDARRRVSITMYSTTWCPHCTRARTWLSSTGLPYVERDVESSETARAQFRQLNPRGGVPAFAVDDEPILVGFSQSSLATTIERAAFKRARR